MRHASTLEDIGAGFGLVALREARGLHRNHPRSPARRLSAAEIAHQGRSFDAMAWQAAQVLRAVLADLRTEA